MNRLAKLTSASSPTAHHGVHRKRNGDYAQSDRQKPEGVGHVRVRERPYPSGDRENACNRCVVPHRIPYHAPRLGQGARYLKPIMPRAEPLVIG